MTALDTITRLSRFFGTHQYVCGGGGNSSVKNPETLWIKPSGTSLGEMTPDRFVAVNRTALHSLYSARMPTDTAERHNRVSHIIAHSVTSDSARPSVETPLHDSLSATYIVHTHPPLVNGVTSAHQGEIHAATLFPDALWIPYRNPGYDLCMEFRTRVSTYIRRKGVEPDVLLLQNHGVFVSGECADDIRTRYASLMSTLTSFYTAAGVALELPVADTAPSPREEDTIRSLYDTPVALVSCGLFHCMEGPLSPEHVTYAGAFPFTDTVSPTSFTAYTREHGHTPHIIVTDTRVYGIGPTHHDAQLALDTALSAALVQHLAKACGGVRTLSTDERAFIEGWYASP